MRFFSMCLFLLCFISLSGQTPAVHFYGDPPTGSFADNFVKSGDGMYRLYGDGYTNARYDSDIFVSLIDENGAPGGELDFMEEDGSQSIAYIEPLPDNRHLVCSYFTMEGQIFRDIKLTIYEADGSEVNSIIIGDIYSDFISRLSVDENGFIYMLVNIGTDVYNIIPDQVFLRKYSADLTEIYSEELAEIYGEYSNLLPLASGQIAYFTADYAGAISGVLHSESGALIWSQEYDSGFFGFQGVTKCVFDGTNIELILPGAARLWTIGPADGNLINETEIPAELPFVSFNSQFLYYAGSYWLFDYFTIYEIQKTGDVFVVESEYFLPTEGGIFVARTEGEDKMLLLTDDSELVRFDTESGSFDFIGSIETSENVSFLERVEHLELSDNELTLGISHNAGFNPYFTLVRATESGEELEKIIIDLDETMNNYEILSLTNDKVSLFSVDQEGQSQISFWNLDGSIRSSTPISMVEGAFANWVESVTLEDGRLIGIANYVNPLGIYFYEIDPINETVEELGDFLTDISIFPGYMHGLEGDKVGFIEAFASGTISALKVDVDGEIVWANTYDIAGELGVNFSPYAEWAVNSTADTYVLGYVTRSNALPPYYDMKVLDTDGNLLQEIRTTDNFIDGTIIFGDDDEILFVGTAYNWNIEEGEDPYLLYYQRYDLEGNLLFERINGIPHLMYFHRLELLPNGTLALKGRVTRFTTIDAVLIIMDEEGTITNITSLQPDWGVLQVGPNPGQDQLNVRLENEYRGTLQVKLIDGKGQQVRSWNADKLTNSWHWQQTLPDLPTGNYWLNISSPEGQVTKAWVKQ